ncbi:hypothetical protein M231_05444 [Tremella mesenterica]|uniref:Uncharacterized protein n=1 Tax=Tremella mesenterica TaxID=5217 RepID=A0A4Q1BI57_TREME|nr:hypothetical protein M231_05444 [Tremella mesenterica]
MTKLPDQMPGAFPNPEGGWQTWTEKDWEAWSDSHNPSEEGSTADSFHTAEQGSEGEKHFHHGQRLPPHTWPAEGIEGTWNPEQLGHPDIHEMYENVGGEQIPWYPHPDWTSVQPVEKQEAIEARPEKVDPWWDWWNQYAAKDPQQGRQQQYPEPEAGRGPQDQAHSYPYGGYQHPQPPPISYQYSYQNTQQAPMQPSNPQQIPSGGSMDPLQLLLINQMMMQQMAQQQQQMYAAQMAQLAGNHGGCSGPAGSVNVQTCQQGPGGRMVRRVIKAPPPPPLAVMTVTETPSGDNWHEATVLLCVLVVVAVYLLSSRKPEKGPDPRKTIVNNLG